MTKAITVYSEIELFDVPFYINGQFDDGADKTVCFSVRVIDKTLGDVLSYILTEVGGPPLHLEAPWNAIEKVRLDSFAFEIKISNGVTEYGLSYSDIGLDLTFIQIDKLKVYYRPKSGEQSNSSLDVSVYGAFLGVDFSSQPISWDALKEQPPATPASSEKTFELEYLGLGQHVSLRNTSELDTISKVIDALRGSYKPLGKDVVDPLESITALTYDESAAWLVGTKFSVLKTFDLSAVWNLPYLAGARIGLRGERAKSLAGLQFEILYRRIAEDLGQYHTELVLPDVLRRFQAGAASVTLPIIAIDIFTDGGFKIDLGFPKDLDFTRSFSIEMLIGPIPVTGSIGVYFGVLSPKAVPKIPDISNGEFRPVIVAGAGFRIGIGKSLEAGILSAGLFVGIEGLLEGILGFYEPFEHTQQKGTYYLVSGKLQLTGHIYGQVNFVIIKAEVDVYAYISVQADFEGYRATLVIFKAGVELKLSVKVGFGIFSFKVSLSFRAEIKSDFEIGEDTHTPWKITNDNSRTLLDRIGPVAYRRLPSGKFILNKHFGDLLGKIIEFPARQYIRKTLSESPTFTAHFHPISNIGQVGDQPGGILQPNKGQVNLVAALMVRLSRHEGETMSPAEVFASSALSWALDEVTHRIRFLGANWDDSRVSLSHLRFIADDLAARNPKIPIDMGSLNSFFDEYITLELAGTESIEESDELTPFPMIPFLTLKTGSDDVPAAESYTWNFETQPLCSISYQRNLEKYFELINNQDPKEESSDILPLELSMAGLIFIDMFKMILRGTVNEAIELLRLYNYKAESKSLEQIAEDTGLIGRGPFERLIAANIDNKGFYKPETTVFIAQKAFVLDENSTISEIAKVWKVPFLIALNSLASQKILRTGTTIEITGGKLLLKQGDTREGILEKYQISAWSEVEEANPNFNWQVPGPVENSPYPTLKLPAGSEINLPTIRYELEADVTIGSLARALRINPITLCDGTDFPLANTGTVFLYISAFTVEGETISELASRIGGLDSSAAWSGVIDNPDIFVSGATISVPQSTYTIARGDTLTSIASRHQLSQKKIREANKEDMWKFIPRPNSLEKLPEGVEIFLPQNPEYKVSSKQTFSSIARLFNLQIDKEIFIGNVDTLKLPGLVSILLPSVTHKVSEGGDSPLEISRLYALDPECLIEANPVVLSGPGIGCELESVIVPDCEYIDRQLLFSDLGTGGSGSALSASVKSLGRFLMAGLRVPAPGGALEYSSGDAGEPVYPLYQLSGQQWPAPADPSLSDWVELTWNDTDDAQKFCASCEVDTASVRVHFTDEDLSIINGFVAAFANLTAIQPAIISQSPVPAVQQIASQIALGSATDWAIPTPISFLPQAEDDNSVQTQLYAVPNNLREILPKSNENTQELELFESLYDPLIDQEVKRKIDNMGWATRLEIDITPISRDGDLEDRLKQVYEVASAPAQTQADIAGIREYMTRNPQAVLDLYLAYPGDDLSALSDSLMSGAISATDRAKISLLKTNLSTISNPPFFVFEAIDPQVASANMTQGKEFLELIWQISITNGGGFFLEYAFDDGLPDHIFEGAKGARLTLVAIVRPSEDLPSSISPHRFHNIAITAQTLSASNVLLSVAAKNFTVQPDVTDPLISEALQVIATRFSIGIETLGLLNATTANLLLVGCEIAAPDPEHVPPSYTVLPGDTLLDVALALGTDVQTLSQSIAGLPGLLELGAGLFVYSKWVNTKNIVAPVKAGLRVLRTIPVDPGGEENLSEADIYYRIQTLFNLMGYALNKNDTFDASHQGLPIVPIDPEDNPDFAFALPEGIAQPWIYDRTLPISPFAESGNFDLLPVIDPYAGLGSQADIGFAFQDIFGNRLPTENDQYVGWQQLYRDPLLPVHSWPSVTLAYDIRLPRYAHSPQMETRIKFAPAGYMPSIGRVNYRLAEKAQADQARFALAYYQCVNQRVKAAVEISLRPDHEEIVESDALASFAKNAFEYLESICALEPVSTVITEKDTFAELAADYGLEAYDLAYHWREYTNLFADGTSLLILIAKTVLPNLSINQIIENSEESITPEQLGEMNDEVLLTEKLFLSIDGVEVKTGPDDTLKSLSTGNYTPGNIAAENADVQSFFSEGATIYLGRRDEPVHKGESLQSLVNRCDQRIENVVSLNAEREVLRAQEIAEIPLHVSIPDDLPNTAKVTEGQSIADFVEAHDAAIRDVLSANCSATGLLKAQEKVYYPDPDYQDDPDKDLYEKVGPEDTLATITLRFAKEIGDDSLQGADVGAYDRNATNTRLLVTESLMLLPPMRIEIQLSIPKDYTRDIVVTELSAEFTIQREEKYLIDPAFIDSAEVSRTYSVIPARLSSKYSGEDRETLRAFATEFQKIFENLKLAIGADRIESIPINNVLSSTLHEPSKLLVVQWDKNRYSAEVEGPASFFAPLPLLNHLWSASDVPIYPYVSGSPLKPIPEPEPEPNTPAYQDTNFSSEDLERWAETLLARIDRVLLPDFSPLMRQLDPQAYQELISAKYAIAQAVSARVNLILEPDSGPFAPVPDVASAQEQMRQQLLIELSAAYRGGIVVQYNVQAKAPKDKWDPSQAPRLLCGMAAEQEKIEGPNPTLDSLAEQFSASTQLVAKVISELQNIFHSGVRVPVGSEPDTRANDSLASLAKRAEVSLASLVDAIRNKLEYLISGADIPLSVRSHKAVADDTFGSILERLAPNLTSRGLIDFAIEILDGMSGDTPGVFIEGINLKVCVDGEPVEHTTTAEDCIKSVAKALKLDVIPFVDRFWLEVPLIRTGAEFKFLALYPSSNISSAKISIFDDGIVPNKMNTVFVTSSPDEASSVSLGIGYRVQAMEYNIQKDDLGGYQASEWLTFINWDQGQDLGHVEIPIPNRRFPLPPTVLGHKAVPKLKDGSINPDQISELFDYDYVLDFSFDAASQDEIFYTQEFNVEDPDAQFESESNQELAYLLAQYQSIDEALFADLSLVGTFEDTPPSPETKAIVKNAFQVFSKLAYEIGAAWPLWQPEERIMPQFGRYRLRRHSHPDGRKALSVTPASSELLPGLSLPRARIKGLPSTLVQAPGLNHSVQEALNESDQPVPRTKRGDSYQVVDPDLTLLVEQNCWGKISITRNADLVGERATKNAFILHIDNVKAIKPLTPAFVVTQRLDVANELGSFKERLKLLLEKLLFKGTRVPLPHQQKLSLTVAFTRPLSELKSAELQVQEPADFTSLFAPVLTTPALDVNNLLETGKASPAMMADAIATNLSEYLSSRDLQPNEYWAISLKLFSSVQGQVSPPLLLEALDLRTRMSDQ